MGARFGLSIYYEDLKRGEKSDRSKCSSFGPLCLSSDSTRCQLSESLAKSKIRRAVPPQIQLPSGALYFRHYEVGRTPRPCGCMGKWYTFLLVESLSFSASPSILKRGSPLLHRCASSVRYLSGPSGKVSIAQVRPTRTSRADGGRCRANIQLGGVP